VTPTHTVCHFLVFMLCVVGGAGTNNDYRRPILHAIAATGVTIHAPLAFGERLRTLVQRSRIVLNLRSFGNADEFKMSRLMLMFANSAFVLSEDMGVEGDVGPYREGMVIVPARDLPNAVQYYLQRPLLRAKIGETGHQIFAARTQAAMLRDPVAKLVQRAGCQQS